MYYNYKRFVMGSYWAYLIGNLGPYLEAQDPKRDLNTKPGFHLTFYNPRWFFLSLVVAVARLQGLCKGLEKRTERI